MTKIKAWGLFSPSFFFLPSVKKNQEKTWKKSVSQLYKVHSERLFIIIYLITWCYKCNCTETSVTAYQLLLLFWHNQNIYHVWPQLFFNQIWQYGWGSQFKSMSHKETRQHVRKQGNQTCLSKHRIGDCFYYKTDRLSQTGQLFPSATKRNFTLISPILPFKMAFWKPSTTLELLYSL